MTIFFFNYYTDAPSIQWGSTTGNQTTEMFKQIFLEIPDLLSRSNLCVKSAPPLKNVGFNFWKMWFKFLKKDSAWIKFGTRETIRKN
jgi:hypothetical protein